jgi:hypothetical protein
MRLSRRLEEAVGGLEDGGHEDHPHAYDKEPEADAPKEPEVEREEGERVPLYLGQAVVVRTKAGERVIEGHIEEMLPETGVVRVRDRSAGTDVQVDLDPEVYDLWIKEVEPEGRAPSPAEATIYVRSSRPGAYSGGRFK